MKNILKDRKGFTLIELLAVIVILAILVMVAIPAVTRYLNYSRQGTFADNAKSAISAVRNDVILNGYSSSCYYTKDQILQAAKKYVESFNGNYQYMKLLKYFIFKEKIGVNGEVEGDSELLNYIENAGQEENLRNDWTSTLS